ncbi:MAG: penicillin-binding protein activator [Hyphomonadaceae bacterium]|nr:penicillin-binding protein activator [Hyphomonadaceae bacterium]
MKVQGSSPPRGRAPSLKPFAAAGVAALLAACASTPTPVSPPPIGPQQPTVDPGRSVTSRDGVTPPFMAGRQIVRVGLLLPFSTRPQDAAALYGAAELALFDHGDGNTLLIPRDSGANNTDAAAAADALMRDGADIIVGPVTREGVEGAARVVRAQNIPVIGFSSDRTVGGDGVYLLSFQLEDEVGRIVSYAATRGVRSMALLAPDNEYGRRVQSALRAQAAQSGVTVAISELYARTENDAASAADRVAAASRTTPVQAILIAESGSVLRAIGPALVRSGVNTRAVRLLGTSAWAGGDAQREPTLAGGWYVASDPSLRTDFEGRYRNAFQTEPTRLSSLAYDAIALATLLARDGGANGLNRRALERQEGFLGSDGVFRFRGDGSIERGLAIMEVRATGAAPVDPAPRRFTPAAS